MHKLAEMIYADTAKMFKKNGQDEFSGRSIVITGASGLLGVYFLASLKRLQKASRSTFNVTAVIRSDPDPYFMDLMDYNGANVIKGDLSNHESLNRIPEADIIIHAAGYGQPGRFMEDKVKTLKLNTLATFHLFDKLKPGGKFLFLSTSEVYSGLIDPPHKEEDIGTTNTTHPRSCYIEAKRCGEAICNAHRAKGIDAKSVRLALAYGPGTRKDDQRVINSFIKKALDGQLTLMDQGAAKRTYCYVSDAVEMMWQILMYGKEPIYNVGGISRITIRDLAIKIGEYLNVPVEFPKVSNDLAGAPDDVRLDITKARGEFHKNDFVPFDEGLAKTIEWQRLLYSGRG